MRKILFILSLLMSNYLYGNEDIIKEQIKYTNIFTFNRIPSVGSYACTLTVVSYKNKQRILTAEHCCSGGSNYPFTILKSNKDIDLCEIKPLSPLPFTRGIILSDKTITPLITTYSFGMVRGYGFHFSKGYVRGYYDENMNYIISTSISIKGISGGPTFDEEGKLLGINSAMEESTSHSIFTSIVRIKEFLDK